MSLGEEFQLMVKLRIRVSVVHFFKLTLALSIGHITSYMVI